MSIFTSITFFAFYFLALLSVCLSIYCTFSCSTNTLLGRATRDELVNYKKHRFALKNDNTYHFHSLTICFHQGRTRMKLVSIWWGSTWELKGGGGSSHYAFSLIPPNAPWTSVDVLHTGDHLLWSTYLQKCFVCRFLNFSFSLWRHKYKL